MQRVCIVHTPPFHMCTPTHIGLTSSLDSLLKTTQAKPSECKPVSQTKETGHTKASELTSTDSTVPDSTHSHGQLSKGDNSHTSDGTHLSRSINKSTSTAPCDSGTSIAGDTSRREFNQREDHGYSYDMSTNDSASFDSSSEPVYKTLIRCHDKLVMALSTDILTISEVLVANEFVPAELSGKMVIPSSTPQEKAIILVNAVIDKIKIAPKRFQELMKIFSEHTCTKDIAEQVSSHISCKQDAEDDSADCDTKVYVISRNQQYAVIEGHMYTAWVTLAPDDKIDLEARLITDAETIRKEFALLCWKVRDSFEQRDIKPRTLASALLDLTIHEDSPDGSCSLLKEKEEALMSAKSVHDTFDVLRPHMNFFNYEILQFLIEGKGSKDDKSALTIFLKNFEEFCKRHVFEVPFTVYSNGQNSDNPITQQRLHVKVTRHFKAALLTQGASESVPTTSDSTQVEKICSNKLGINLEDAKNIQRKLAKILNLKPSSLFLDSISEGSVILTFLLPVSESLAGLDCKPEIALLSCNGLTVIILCGPPGKPELKELTQKGLAIQWSQPEYGCNTLAKYTLYYQKKCEHETSEWQKLELDSLENHTCVPDLNVGDTYVFKICTVSDAGTLQYSDESDPITRYNSGISVKDFHTMIIKCHEMTTLALFLANHSKIVTSLLAKKIITEENETEITLASRPNEILAATLHKRITLEPEKFLEFLNILSKESLIDNIVETLWSVYYHGVCIQYAGYLKFLYVSLHNKQTSSNQWPPSVTHKFFRLAMIKTATIQRGKIDDRFVRMTITGKVDDILRQKYPIELKNIFLATPGRRKVILLEGAPGCGKSTLSVYICQQWEKGQLFNQFKHVILIRLRDPAVRNAKCLADLLPCPDTKTAQLLAGIMMERKCQDVLFILDGWDELPFYMRRKPIFDTLVNSTLPWSNSLSKSAVIVTSRPISSGDLYSHVSSRVEILGFTPDELYQFFAECLKGDTEAVKTLLEKIEENPEVAGSCYLPLNATILVHLFKSDRNAVPTTQYGIFSRLILNCMQRHLKLRTQYKDVSIESLDQLPEVTKKPFIYLCQIAYDGVMEDKIIFTSLPSDVNTLSLLQGVKSFIGRKKAVSHNFIHLSIQELLAAWYIATQLPASEQVSKFSKLFNKSRFSAVFQFYTAFTKLKTPGIEDVIINIVKKYCRSQYHSGDKDKKVLIISLLHCLYEAQDPSLCESVAQRLLLGLDLSDTTLTPSDCLSIGYFLANVCKCKMSRFKVDLRNCSIDDRGWKYLIGGLYKCLDTHSAVTALLTMHLEKNIISHEGVHYLSTLLKIGCINYFNLLEIDLSSKQDKDPLGTFTEHLKNNTTLRKLRLEKCGLNSLSIVSLAEALVTNKHLEVMHIRGNPLCDDGIRHLACALRVNQGLIELLLVSCGMTDVGLECLAKSLQRNNVLIRLYVSNYYDHSNPNRLTDKIAPVLTECLQNNHTLTELVLPEMLRSSATSIEEAVNDVRKRSRLPLIKGMSVPLNENSM